MAFFTWYSWSWLQSIGLASAAADGYKYHAGFSWPTLWICTVLLFLIANGVLWASSGRAWALWVTFVFFGTFVAIKYFWLDPEFAQFKVEHNLSEAAFSAGPFLAVIIIGLAAVIAFFDQILVIRLHQKAYPPAVDSSEINPEAP